MPEDFNETILTPEEMEYAIYDARCEKYFIEKEKKEKARKAKDLLECCTPFTTQQLREYVLQQHPSFIVDKQNEDIFNKLCQYFSNDPDFENDGLSLSKGILLTGPVGVGKSNY